MFDVPILLLAYNRPDKLSQLINSIAVIQPKYLYVFADGYKDGDELDRIKCLKVRQSLTELITWECEVQTLFKEHNLGCGLGPAEGITWFFNNEEEGIILEDDCIPHQSFFTYCKSMLTLYREDTRVSVVSGTNQLRRWKADSRSHIISRFGSTWGWATWRRAWILFEHKLDKWASPVNKQYVRAYLRSDIYYDVISEQFNEYENPDRINDVWDFYWLFSRMFNNTYSVVSPINLVSNVGFGDDANHTFNPADKLAGMPTFNYNEVKYSSDTSFAIDEIFDWLVFEVHINPCKRSLFKKIILKVIKMFYKIV